MGPRRRALCHPTVNISRVKTMGVGLVFYVTLGSGPIGPGSRGPTRAIRFERSAPDDRAGRPGDTRGRGRCGDSGGTGRGGN